MCTGFPTKMCRLGLGTRALKHAWSACTHMYINSGQIIFLLIKTEEHTVAYLKVLKTTINLKVFDFYMLVEVQHKSHALFGDAWLTIIHLVKRPKRVSF